MHRASLLFVAVLAACTGDPVGEAPSDSSVTPDGDSTPGADSKTLDTHVSETPPGDTTISEVGEDTSGEETPPTPRVAGKACTTTTECDPDGTLGGGCLLKAPTPMCYGAKCSTPTTTAISPCPDDGVCVDDGLGAGTGLCVPLCYFDRTNGNLVQGCLGKNACWFVGELVIDGINAVWGRCEGRCGTDADCPGNVCQNDGSCVPSAAAYELAIGDACTSADDAAGKCACVYGPPDGKGYCSKFCHVDDASCPSGYTCDADVPGTAVIPSSGMLGNCLKNCTVDGDCTNGYCEQHAGVATKTCQPGTKS